MSIPSISLCIIVKNEEEFIDRCLSSIYKHVDEIIITDTGSTDRTIQIAKKYTDKIYHYNWNNSFCKARNYCQKHATSDFILWMDGDERFNLYGASMLKRVIGKHHDITIFSLRYNDPYTEIPDTTLMENYKLRLFKNNHWYKRIWDVHEIIDVFPRSNFWPHSFINDVCIYHMGYNSWQKWRNLKNYINYLDKEPENNTIAYHLLLYYLKEWNMRLLEKTIKQISYIHPNFYDLFLLFSKKLAVAWYKQEVREVKKLIKKSQILYKRRSYKL